MQNIRYVTSSKAQRADFPVVPIPQKQLWLENAFVRVASWLPAGRTKLGRVLDRPAPFSTLRGGCVLKQRTGGIYVPVFYSSCRPSLNKGFARKHLCMWLGRKRSKKPLHSLKVIELYQLANVSFTLLQCDSSFIEQGPGMWTLSHRVPEYRLLFL